LFPKQAILLLETKSPVSGYKVAVSGNKVTRDRKKVACFGNKIAWNRNKTAGFGNKCGQALTRHTSYRIVLGDAGFEASMFFSS